MEIHTTDALLGRGTTQWSPQLCAHLVEHLGRRVPAGFAVTLTATDGPWTWTRGDGVPLAIRGALTDLAAWPAGRHPVVPLAGGPLPPLGDWP